MGAGDVVAAAAAQIWDDVVTNTQANPRYRAETWQMIGKHAGLLGDNRPQIATGDGVTVQIGAELAREIVERMIRERNNG